VHRFTLGQLVLVMGLTTSAVAQYTPGAPQPGATGGGTYGPGSGSDGGRPMRGGGRMGAPADRSSMPTPSRIEGPATPAVMHDTIGVTGEPMDRYAVIYANHMATTGPARDSLRSSMKEMREVFQTGGRDAARKMGSDLRRQWKDLSKRDQEFEKALKDLLSKDQQKKYKKWKEAREKAEEELLKDRRRRAGEGRR
jgi:hypothetical protein